MFRMMLLLSLSFLGVTLQGQAPIYLRNPSFEDEPRRSKTPLGWYLCGPPNHTPPDVHPRNLFEVKQAPADGVTYLGMVARGDGTAEAIGQHLSAVMQAGTYQLDFYAAVSGEYFSYSEAVGQLVHFDAPLHLAIYGSSQPCGQEQLLGRSVLINHLEWKSHRLILQVRQPVTRLLLKVEHPRGDTLPRHGSMLLDGLSPLIPVHGEAQAPGIALAPPVSPQGVEELREKLIALLAQLQVNDGQWQPHCQLGAGGHVLQGNKYLAAIAQLLAGSQQRPSLAIYPKTPYAKQLALAVRLAMARAGYNPRQYRLQIASRAGQRWLGDGLLKIKLK